MIKQNRYFEPKKMNLLKMGEHINQIGFTLGEITQKVADVNCLSVPEPIVVITVREYRKAEEKLHCLDDRPPSQP